MARHYTNFAGIWCDDTRAIGANKAARRPFQSTFDAHHVKNRNTLGDRYNNFHLSIDCFEDGVCCERGWHVYYSCIRFCNCFCFMHRIEHGKVQVRLTTFAWCHASNHLCSISNGLLGMESALAASKALADHLGVFVDEYGHLVAPN